MSSNYPLFNIRGKVTVVAGGIRGIGMMIAEGLVKAGVKSLRCVTQGRRLR